MNSDINNLVIVTEKLEQFGINYSLGGSGLLLSLGLFNFAHDWDIMTDAPKETIIDALRNFKVEELKSGDYPFGSEYKLLIHKRNPQVEILGNFSIYSTKGLCKMPTVPTSSWNGVQVSAPEVWFVAYALMNRMDKANLLFSFLKNNGARNEILNKLMKEPLPDELLHNLESLFIKHNEGLQYEKNYFLKCIYSYLY
ncbi:hypothetical protein NSQ29_03925 [Paenibacillus sp. FSL F4-0236]|uniref:hypothetical protein n=1 Tax=Paenibacillus sp. FSL F4-0236 TaxID=2954731 RepID=UPI0030F5A191